MQQNRKVLQMLDTINVMSLIVFFFHAVAHIYCLNQHLYNLLCYLTSSCTNHFLSHCISGCAAMVQACCVHGPIVAAID